MAEEIPPNRNVGSRSLSSTISSMNDDDDSVIVVDDEEPSTSSSFTPIPTSTDNQEDFELDPSQIYVNANHVKAPGNVSDLMVGIVIDETDGSTTIETTSGYPYEDALEDPRCIPLNSLHPWNQPFKRVYRVTQPIDTLFRKARDNDTNQINFASFTAGIKLQQDSPRMPSEILREGDILIKHPVCRFSETNTVVLKFPILKQIDVPTAENRKCGIVRVKFLHLFKLENDTLFNVACGEFPCPTEPVKLSELKERRATRQVVASTSTALQDEQGLEQEMFNQRLSNLNMQESSIQGDSENDANLDQQISGTKDKVSNRERTSNPLVETHLDPDRNKSPEFIDVDMEIRPMENAVQGIDLIPESNLEEEENEIMDVENDKKLDLSSLQSALKEIIGAGEKLKVKLVEKRYDIMTPMVFPKELTFPQSTSTTLNENSERLVLQRMFSVLYGLHQLNLNGIPPCKVKISGKTVEIEATAESSSKYTSAGLTETFEKLANDDHTTFGIYSDLKFKIRISPKEGNVDTANPHSEASHVIYAEPLRFPATQQDEVIEQDPPVEAEEKKKENSVRQGVGKLISLEQVLADIEKRLREPGSSPLPLPVRECPINPVCEFSCFIDDTGGKYLSFGNEEIENEHEVENDELYNYSIDDLNNVDVELEG